MLAGNTSDKTTLPQFLKALEDQYGQAERVWVMDRGIPTEETLQAMRETTPPVPYLVGTPKGRLNRLQQALLTQPWAPVRESVQVKLREREGELYVLACSAHRVHQGRAMRRRRLKKLWRRLHELQAQKLSRDELLLKLGAAKQDAGRAYGLIELHLPAPEEPVSPATFRFTLRKDQRRLARRREGR